MWSWCSLGPINLPSSTSELLYCCSVMSLLSRGYSPRLKTLPHVCRMSISSCRHAKWYMDQPIFDANPPDGTWESEVRIAPGQDAAKVLSKLNPLLFGHGGSQPHPWDLCSDGQGNWRSFYFKTFNETWAFMQAVSDRCKSKRHHPEWWNVKQILRLVVYVHLFTQ